MMEQTPKLPSASINFFMVPSFKKCQFKQAKITHDLTHWYTFWHRSLSWDKCTYVLLLSTTCPPLLVYNSQI